MPGKHESEVSDLAHDDGGEIVRQGVKAGESMNWDVESWSEADMAGV